MAMTPFRGRQISTANTLVIRSRHGARFTGSKNLHLIDASIMPSIPEANPNMPTIMVAEGIASV